MNYRVDEHNITHTQDIPAQGICRVVCFSPKHNITLAEMEEEEIVKVIHEFRNQFQELSVIPEIKNVMLGFHVRSPARILLRVDPKGDPQGDPACHTAGQQVYNFIKFCETRGVARRVTQGTQGHP